MPKRRIRRDVILDLEDTALLPSPRLEFLLFIQDQPSVNYLTQPLEPLQCQPAPRIPRQPRAPCITNRHLPRTWSPTPEPYSSPYPARHPPGTQPKPPPSTPLPSWDDHSPFWPSCCPLGPAGCVTRLSAGWGDPQSPHQDPKSGQGPATLLGITSQQNHCLKAPHLEEQLLPRAALNEPSLIALVNCPR